MGWWWHVHHIFTSLVDVVLGGMFLAVVVCHVDPPSFPDEVELLLSFSTFEKVEPHVVLFCALGDHGLLDQTVRRSVVCDCRCFWLCMSHLFQGDA